MNQELNVRSLLRTLEWEVAELMKSPDHFPKVHLVGSVPSSQKCHFGYFSQLEN